MYGCTNTTANPRGNQRDSVASVNSGAGSAHDSSFGVAPPLAAFNRSSKSEHGGVGDPVPRLAHGGPSPRKGSMPFQECLQKVGKVFKLSMDEQVSQDEQKERCFAAILKACQEKNWEDVNHCKRALVQITDQAGRNVLLHTLASGDRECAVEMISRGSPCMPPTPREIRPLMMPPVLAM